MEIKYCELCFRKMHVKYAQCDELLNNEHGMCPRNFFQQLCDWHLSEKPWSLVYIPSSPHFKNRDMDKVLAFLEFHRFIVTLESLDEMGTEIIYARPLGLRRKENNLVNFCISRH